jgi:O-Antigen ligase
MIARSGNMQMDRRGVTFAEKQMTTVTIRIVFVTLLLWTLGGGSGGGFQALADPAGNMLKYVVYTLPLTLGLAYYATFSHDQMRIDTRGATALALYLMLAVTAMAANSWFNFYGVRDLLIIGGYLLLFACPFRAPAEIIDFGLAALAVCMVVEVSRRLGPDINILGMDGIYGFLGLSTSFGTGLFGSHGILESTLGFPFGAILLYYAHCRKWRRVVVVTLLMFMAFKRITFIGVAVALSFDSMIGHVRSFRLSRTVAIVVVVGLSVAAILSTQIFELLAGIVEFKESSADSISVGRYDIAVMLWKQLDSGQLSNWLFGFGPGAADFQVASHFILINPHNDWLKILFDYGLIGFVGMHIVLLMTFGRHRLGLMVYLYSATLMLTDNIFIYMFYHLFLAMIMCASRRKQHHGGVVRSELIASSP